MTSQSVKLWSLLAVLALLLALPLTGLAAQLQTRSDLDARQHSPHNGPSNLDGFDAAIVDFNAVDPADILAMLRARPGLKIVGVNAAAGAVTVLSGKVYLAQTLSDVVACLE